MGIKSTIDLTRLEALHIIAEYVGAEFEKSEEVQIERILEKVSCCHNPDSKYYFDNFNVRNEKIQK